MTEDRDEKYDVVRIRAELIPLIDKIVDENKDRFGIQKYRSRQEVVSQALREFLDRQAKEAAKK